MKINTQKTKILLGVACLIFLISSFPFVQALTTPIPNQLVVRLEDSQAVNNAIVNLEQNLPNLVVLDYDSAEYKLKYWRFLGVAIWVSHGSEEGVMINGELTQWDVLEDPIKGTPNKDIVLSCYSNELVKQTDLSSADVLTFSGELDAVFGSLVVSYALSKDSALIPKIISRAKDIAVDPSNVNPLVILLDDGGGGGGGGGTTTPNYEVHHLSTIELRYYLLSLFLLLALLYVNLKIPADLPFVQKMAIEFGIAAWLTIIVTLKLLFEGSITLEAAIGDIIGWFVDALDIFYAYFMAAADWEKVVVGVALFLALFALAIELAGDAASAGALTVAKFIAATASFMVLAVSFYNDYEDLDTIVG